MEVIATAPPAPAQVVERPLYEIVMKQVVIAFVIEGIIIIAGLIGNYSLIPEHERLNYGIVLTAMLAPIAYAAMEIARVPLGLATRTQTTFWPKVIATIGLILAAGITTKTMVSLGERMYHARLIEVVEADRKKTETGTALTNMESKIAALDAEVDARAKELATVDDRLKQTNTEMGALPPPKTVPIYGTNAKGKKWKSFKTVTDPRTGVMSENLKRAQTDRGEAGRRLDEARAKRAAVDPAQVQMEATNAASAMQAAVLNSQLHSLAGMIHGKNPVEITMGEVFAFQRYFVFLAAVCVAFASTLLAVTAVRRFPQNDLDIDASAGEYILGPFAEEIITEARTRARSDMQRAIHEIPDRKAA
jgi:hypothetical protein